MGEDAFRGRVSRYRTEHSNQRERERYRAKKNKSLFWLTVYYFVELIESSTYVWKFIKKLSEIHFN